MLPFFLELNNMVTTDIRRVSMYNYYSYNRLPYYPYPMKRIIQQPLPKQTQQAFLDLNVADADKSDLGDGFTHYEWFQEGVDIREGTRLAIRLIAENHERVISAGWRVRGSQPVVAYTLAPLSTMPAF